MADDTSDTRVGTLPKLGNLEWLYAQNQTQSFPKHTHERYAVGVIERGALGFYYRGEQVVASPGDISLCIPGEAHTGQPAREEGWSYRMFYLDTRALEDAASELARKPRGLPFFGAGVLQDKALARQLRLLHLKVQQGEAPLLEQETLLRYALIGLIKRHADDAPAKVRVGSETYAVSQVKAYLDAHYAEDVSLAALSDLTGLSRFYLVRTFHQAVGVPPHSYLRQVRVQRAKALLAEGNPIAEVALMTGFGDQSHLTRWFKRFWGFTPGQYRKGVQDAAL